MPSGQRSAKVMANAFNAGFLSAYLTNGGDPVASCLAAHALSARVLRCPGATEPPLTPSASPETGKEVMA